MSFAEAKREIREKIKYLQQELQRLKREEPDNRIAWNFREGARIAYIVSLDVLDELKGKVVDKEELRKLLRKRPRCFIGDVGHPDCNKRMNKFFEKLEKEIDK